jgi:hypothetical protein
MNKEGLRKPHRALGDEMAFEGKHPAQFEEPVPVTAHVRSKPGGRQKGHPAKGSQPASMRFIED